MKHTTSAEDRATDSIQDMANHVVEAIRKLDALIEERDETIEYLKREIEELKEEIRELERNQA